jgi:hypothetical protein
MTTHRERAEIALANGHPWGVFIDAILAVADSIDKLTEATSGAAEISDIPQALTREEILRKFAPPSPTGLTPTAQVRTGYRPSRRIQDVELPGSPEDHFLHEAPEQ